MQILNFDVIKQPMNWITVLLMVFIGGIVFHLVMKHWQNN